MLILVGVFNIGMPQKKKFMCLRYVHENVYKYL